MAKTISNIRAFNRFYTDIIGLLDKHLLNSNYSLAEARILYEIYNSKSIKAAEIMQVMHIDKSYLSRLLKKLEKEKLVIKTPCPEDARVMFLSLTPQGLKEFEILNQASVDQITQLLEPISEEHKKQLELHMSAIKHILKPNI